MLRGAGTSAAIRYVYAAQRVRHEETCRLRKLAPAAARSAAEGRAESWGRKVASAPIASPPSRTATPDTYPARGFWHRPTPLNQTRRTITTRTGGTPTLSVSVLYSEFRTLT